MASCQAFCTGTLFIETDSILHFLHTALCSSRMDGSGWIIRCEIVMWKRRIVRVLQVKQYFGNDQTFTGKLLDRCRILIGHEDLR